MRALLVVGSLVFGVAAVLAGVLDAPGSMRPTAVAAGATALVLLGGALAGAAWLLPVAVVTAAVPVLVALHAHDRGADPVAGLVAGALAVCILLAVRSLDAAAGLELTGARLRAELGAAGAAGIGATGAAFGVLSVAGTRAPGGSWRLALGLGAALGVVLLLVGAAAVAQERGRS